MQCIHIIVFVQSLKKYTHIHTYIQIKSNQTKIFLKKTTFAQKKKCTNATKKPHTSELCFFFCFFNFVSLFAKHLLFSYSHCFSLFFCVCFLFFLFVFHVPGKTKHIKNLKILANLRNFISKFFFAFF